MMTTVAGVDVRGENRLVLTAQQARNLGAQAAEHQVLGVDHVPRARDFAGFWAVSSHFNVPFMNKPGRFVGDQYQGTVK